MILEQFSFTFLDDSAVFWEKGVGGGREITYKANFSFLCQFTLFWPVYVYTPAIIPRIFMLHALLEHLDPLVLRVLLQEQDGAGLVP